MNEEKLNIAKKLYLEDRLSVADIAIRIGEKYNILRKELIKTIKLRKNGETKKVTSKDIDNLICKDYNNGMSLRCLSKKFNVDRSTVNRVLREGGVKKRNILESNIKKKIDFNQILNLFNSGNTINKISVIMNLSPGTIRNHLIKNNIIDGVVARNQTAGNSLDQKTIDLIIKKYQNGETCGEIGRELKLFHQAISNTLKRYGIPMRRTGLDNRKYTINENYFDDIHTPSKYFLLGLLFTDGSNMISDSKYRVTLELQAEDLPTIEFVKKEFETNKPLFFNKKKNTWQIYINSKKISIDLHNLGCIQNKTYCLTFPEWVRDDLFIHFLHGLICGDGYVSIKQIGLIGTKNLVQNISKKMKILFGRNGYMRECQESKHVNEIVYDGKLNNLKLMNLIYKNAPFIMKRKYLKYEELLENMKNVKKHKYPPEPLLEAESIQRDIRQKFAYLFT